MTELPTFIVGAFSLILGSVFGYLIRQVIAKKKEGTAEAKFNKLVSEAKESAKKIEEKAHKNAESILEKATEEEKEKHSHFLQLEKRLLHKEEFLEERENKLKKKSKELTNRSQELEGQIERVKEIKEKRLQELERISGLSSKQAREELLVALEKEHGEELTDRLKKLEEYAQDEMDKRAKNMIVHALQRYASSQTSEITTTAVDLPSDDIKGRIIGKEGRNIRAIERLTGVELIVDDTPETIIISGFDPIRRHIAKLSLEKLIIDGRIQPARIEDAVLK